jgi:hypothetical protein
MYRSQAARDVSSWLAKKLDAAEQAKDLLIGARDYLLKKEVVTIKVTTEVDDTAMEYRDFNK